MGGITTSKHYGQGQKDTANTLQELCMVKENISYELLNADVDIFGHVWIRVCSRHRMYIQQ